MSNEPTTTTMSDESNATGNGEPGAAIVGDEPNDVAVRGEPATAVGDEPNATTVSEEPAAIVGDEPAATVGDEPNAAAVSDEQASAVSDEPSATTMSEEPATTVSDEPATTMSKGRRAATMRPEPTAITALSDVKPVVKKPPPAPRRRKTEDLEQDQLPDEEINAAGRKWYFVHTYSGHENKVRHAIRSTVEQSDAKDKVFHVVVPTEDEIEIREGQRRTVKKKLYPGYVLIQTIELREGDPPSDYVWHLIRDTAGVTGFVSSGTRPVALSQEEVNHILRAMRMEQPRVRVGFQVGQNVRIVDGPFEDFVGTVDEINTDRGKVKVLVNMFGRETPVDLDFLAVEKL